MIKFSFILSFVGFIQVAYSQGGMSMKTDANICKREVKKSNSKYTETECGKTAGIVDCNQKLEMSFDMTLVVTSSNKTPFSGKCEVCHNSGALKIVAEYKNGRSIGVDTAFYEDGVCELIRSHIDGVENGKWMFFDSLGRIEWIKNYSLGVLNGSSIEFYNDPKNPKSHDTLRAENYINGVLNGLKIQYFSNGLRKKVVNYKNGLMDGNFIVYNSDTVIIEELNFVEGKKDGIQKYYYEDGVLLRTESFSKDARDGETKVFFYDQSIQSIEHFRKGSGKELEYLTTETYECSSKEIADEVAQMYIDKTPRKKIIETIGSKGTVKAIDDQKVLQGARTYLNAARLGMGINKPFKHKKLFYVVVVNKAEKIIKKEERHGDFEEHYPDGKLKRKAVYDNDVLIEEHTFDEQGKEISTFGALPYAGDEDDAMPGSEKKSGKASKEEKKKKKAAEKARKKAEKEAKKKAKAEKK